MKVVPVETKYRTEEDGRIERILLLVSHMLEGQGVKDFRHIWDLCSHRQHAEWDLTNSYYADKINGHITQEQYDEYVKYIEDGEIYKLPDMEGLDE